MVCIICFQEESPAEASTTCGCDAQICNECIETYVFNHVRGEYSLAKSSIASEVPCPACKGLWNYEYVARRVSTETLAAFDTSVARSALGVLGVSCPSCDVISWRDTSSAPAAGGGGGGGCNKEEQCSACARYIGRGKETWRQWCMSQGYKMCATRRCPDCHSPIEKNGGCMHMTCSRCSHQFCWKCSGNWFGHNYAFCALRQSIPFLVAGSIFVSIMYWLFGLAPVYFVWGVCTTVINFSPIWITRWLFYWPIYICLHLLVLAPSVHPLVYSYRRCRMWYRLHKSNSWQRHAAPSFKDCVKEISKYVALSCAWGAIVYAVYIWHPAFLTGFFDVFSLVLAAIAAVASICAGSVLFGFKVVVPCTRIVRRQGFPFARRVMDTVVARLDKMRSWFAVEENQEQDLAKWSLVWDARATTSRLY